MRSIEDKGCYNYGSGSVSDNPNANQPGIEVVNKGGGNRASHQQRKVLSSLAKPTPSKWDDAQKWLAGLSRGGGADHGHGKTNKPRNSNAEDRRLITANSQKGRDSCASIEEGLNAMDIPSQEEGDTKKIDCSESFWRINKPAEDALPALRSVCVRDMGTEMTPIASLEPSRTATPIRAISPSLRSPITSRSSTPGRARQGGQMGGESYQMGLSSADGRSEAMAIGMAIGMANGAGWPSRECKDSGGCKGHENCRAETERKASSLESRAVAWDEAERAKYLARYKREEVKIQAWEGHQKRKAEMEMRRMEVKAERMKARAQEKLANKLAATRRIAEEKRANAEAKLNDQAAKTSERADYIRRTGHLPSSSFSLFKLPSICW